MVFSFLSGFSSVCIKLGMLFVLFKMQVEKNTVFTSLAQSYITKQFQGLIHTCMDALKSEHSPFAVHKASLDCRGGRRSKSDLSYAFCRDCRKEVHKFYFCRDQW